MPRSTGAPTGGIPKAGYPGAFGSAFRRRSSWVIGRASAIFPNAEHGTTGVAPRLASPISGSRPCQRSVDRHLRDRGRRLYLWTASRAVRASYTTRRRPASGQYCCRFRQAIVEGHGQRHHSFVECSRDQTKSVFSRFVFLALYLVRCAPAGPPCDCDPAVRGGKSCPNLHWSIFSIFGRLSSLSLLPDFLASPPDFFSREIRQRSGIVT